MEDADYRQLIDALIGVMHKNGSLKNPAVEQAFREVPRHLFLPDEPLERAYQDIAIPIKKSHEGVPTSASSQPTIMAIMLEQLDLQPGMRVLEIGAGTGFNAALMANIVGETGSVVTIDIQPDLIEQARINLDRAGFGRVQAIAADGGEGYSPGAPYDRIILTASSWVITTAWREQLKDGGRIVLPLSLFNGPMQSTAFERREEQLIFLSSSPCGFMPLQGAFAGPPPFQIHTGRGERLLLTSQKSLPVDALTFSQWLTARREAIPTGVKGIVWDVINGFLSWLSVRSPHGIATLAAEGDAVDDLVSLALIAMNGQQKRADTFLKILPGSAAALTRRSEAELVWHIPELAEKDPPEQPFEVYVQQLGPNPEAAQFLVRMIQAWEAAGKPNTSRLCMRGIPAGKSVHLLEGEFLIERPWTNFIVWYQD